MKLEIILVFLVGYSVAQWYGPPVNDYYHNGPSYIDEPYESPHIYHDSSVSPYHRGGRGGGTGGFWYYYGPEQSHGWGRGIGGGGYGGYGHGGGGGYGHGGGGSGWAIGGFGGGGYGGGWGWRRRGWGIPRLEVIVPLWRLRGWGWRGW